MGYLAVLLGNGSLEVWDVPLPHAMKSVYSSSNLEGTDPRFVKIKPVFRCSTLKCGGFQSIPLVVEWSTSYPHDYLLAGCHDGTVALWKFSASGTSGDTRPLLCFSADTVPIRAIAWVPSESDQESPNLFLTSWTFGPEVLGHTVVIHSDLCGTSIQHRNSYIAWIGCQIQDV
uniref:Anaphase-promoting complex subunit 4 WD40 domain-containing protein n=1 Tax=Salix viminalis TaxID=40686 RepID=A0A6N2KZ02_SALVM